MRSIPEKKFRSQTEGILHLLFDWVAALVMALAVLITLFIFLFRVVVVDGDSMQTTLYDKDRLVLWTVGYHPEQGDIVVVDRYATDPLIKRVVAVEGDVVEITHDCKFFLNGEAQHESYIQGVTVPRDVSEPVTVPAGYVFVMGDNRTISKDSRMTEIGLVNIKDIVGKAVYRHWPLQSFGGVYNNLEDNLGQ